MRAAPTTGPGGLTLRTGFEIELLAPPGSDRQDLADLLAERCAGTVRRAFHTDSEPSAVAGIGTFWHLSPAFDVVDAGGAPVARLVDDLTISTDLAGTRVPPGHRGWYRVLCDDIRLLRIVERLADPDAALPDVLGPVAALVGTQVDLVGGAARVNDRAGATIAVAMPLPGGRERPCEIITPPLTRDHGRALRDLLEPARELGFTVPVEAAVHLHVDGGPFRTPGAFANLVRLFGHWQEPLRDVLGTNLACRRLGALPVDLVTLVESRPVASWAELGAAARATGLTKYADVNLTQLVAAHPVRDTVEIRMLPGAADATEVMQRASLVEALLLRCLDAEPIPLPGADAGSDPLAAVRSLTGRAA